MLFFIFLDGVLLSLDDSSLFSPIPQGTLYVNNFVCPDEEPFNYLEECNFNLTYTEECLSGSQIYAIQCFDYRGIDNLGHFKTFSAFENILYNINMIT